MLVVATRSLLGLSPPHDALAGALLGLSPAAARVEVNRMAVAALMAELGQGDAEDGQALLRVPGRALHYSFSQLNFSIFEFIYGMTSVA